jgi:hypothetical protein
MSLTRSHSTPAPASLPPSLQVLDMAWAPVLCRGSLELLRTLHERRAQHVVDCCPALKVRPYLPHLANPYLATYLIPI